MDDRHLEDGEVGEGEFLVARGDATTLLEPGDAALDDIARTVDGRIEDSTAAATALLVGSLRNDGLDLAPVKPMPNVAKAVSLVAGQATGPASLAACP